AQARERLTGALNKQASELSELRHKLREAHALTGALNKQATELTELRHKLREAHKNSSEAAPSAYKAAWISEDKPTAYRLTLNISGENQVASVAPFADLTPTKAL
ncbi:hypothetical protein CYMTET_33868, partial [Cymbomonas tetramitiformis]